MRACLYFFSLSLKIFDANSLSTPNSSIFSSTAYNGELCTWFDKREFSFFFFPFKEKLYPPVCSKVFASLQAQGCRPRDCNKAGNFFLFFYFKRVHACMLVVPRAGNNFNSLKFYKFFESGVCWRKFPL